MTIVEGQIETLKKLKESLSRNGITRFSSIGEIRSFVKEFELEKMLLPNRIKDEVETEIQDMQSTLASCRKDCDELKARSRSEIKQEIHNLESELKLARDKSNRNIFLKVLYFLRISSLARRASRLDRRREKIVKKKTRSGEKTIAKLERTIERSLESREKVIAERCKKSLDELTYTKEVVDGLYKLVAGAVGEAAVVNTLQQLSDDYYLINDFSIKFSRPIYNRKENDKIYSIQIDHLLVCKSGIFLLETKNWSKSSIENLDLRSPVKQIRRTSFALFVLLNSGSRHNNIKLDRHHWGTKKIPIKNVVVMINEKPKAEFRHVKIISLKELNGYIQYFDKTFSDDEVKSIFEDLKRRMEKSS
jgi:hypothetical protein